MPADATGAARLFFAVFPPTSLQRELHEALADVAPSFPGLRWTRAEALHLTLRFLGDVPRDAIPALVQQVEPIGPAIAPFPVRVEGFGVFPSSRNARVLWLGVTEGANTLGALARRLNRTLSEAGWPQPDKPFQAHLTVGRWRERAGLRAVLPDFPAWAFRAGTLDLMESRLGPGGARYTRLASIEFGSKD